MLEESKKSFFTEKVKKMNEFAEKNLWVKFFLWFPSLVALIWKILVWVYWKILFKLWKRLEEINRRDWDKINFVLALLHLFIAIALVCLFHLREKKAKNKLEKELKWVEIERETKRIMIKMKEAKQRKN